MRVAVVIVHYGPSQAVGDCLESLDTCGVEADNIILVDNPSPGSDGELEDLFPGITVLRPKENLGYAGGANLGLRRAVENGFDVALVLNHDIRLQPDCVPALEQVFAAQTDAGIVGAIPCYPATGAPHFTRAAIDYRRGKPGIDDTDPRADADPYPTDYATGCSMAVRCQTLEDVGYFDEAFFLYWEDVDLSLRAGESGWQVLMAPAARVTHAVSAATGHGSPLSIYYQTRNRLRFFARHTPGTFRRKRLVARILVSRLLLGLGRILSGRTAAGRAYLQGVVDYLRGRGGIRPEYHE